MSSKDHKSNSALHRGRLAETLVSEHRWLRTVAFARTGYRDVVDEVMQEVAVAAARQKKLDGEQNTNGWLYRVTVRQALLHRRRRGQRSKHEEANGHEASTNAHDREVDPLSHVLAAEEAELVRCAMRKLSPPDRELLLLKYTEDWSCRQLAERIGCSISAVENRLARARKRLRSLLMHYDRDRHSVVQEESTNP